MQGARSLAGGRTGGFVMCSRHNARRKAACCEEVPIFDADHNVVGTSFVCRAGETCVTASAAGRARGATGLAAAAAASATAPAGAQSPPPPSSSSPSAGAAVFNCSSSHMTQDDGSRRQSAAATVRDDKLFSVSFTRSGPTKATDGASNGSSDDDDDDESGDASTRRPPKRAHVEVSQEESATALPPAPTPLARGRPRYYDLTNGVNRTGGGDGGQSAHYSRKVCWNCGLGGHEKPDCPNALCRLCHDHRAPHQYHVCSPMTTPSPFVVLPSSLPFTSATMTLSTAARVDKTDCGAFDAVRCLRCNAYGHLDCGPHTREQLRDSVLALEKAAGARGMWAGGVNILADVVQFRRLSCCFCGMLGHNGYDCNQRERTNGDLWVQRNYRLQQPLLDAPAARAAGSPTASYSQYVRVGAERHAGGDDSRRDYGGVRNNRGAANISGGAYGGVSRAATSHRSGEGMRNSPRGAGPYSPHSGAPRDQSNFTPHDVAARQPPREQQQHHQQQQQPPRRNDSDARTDRSHRAGHGRDDGPRSGYGRRGGRRGHSGFSDEEDLF